MAAMRRIVLAACLFGGSLIAKGCGGDDPSSSRRVASGPEPAAMCPPGETPVLAAYDVDSGSHQWSACSPSDALSIVRGASEETVYVMADFGPYPGAAGASTFIAYDAATGAELWRGGETRYDDEVGADSDADVTVREAPVVDGVQLSGGQDDPMTAVDVATGELRWTRPGMLVYDDAWAVGDAAVFAVERKFFGNVLVAYEVDSGEIRWQKLLVAYLWPWHVAGDRLLVMWNNLQVVSTDDGRVLWETRYAEPTNGFPRMMGGVTNSHSLFVSFTSRGSPGD